MKIFLLTLVIVGVVHGDWALSSKTKREILPGDPRFGTDYQRQHYNVHSASPGVSQFGSYLPPNAQFGKTENKPNLQLPATSYGVPFRTEAVSQTQTASNQYLTPIENNAPTSYGTPALNHFEAVSHLPNIEHHLINPVPDVGVQTQSNIAAPLFLSPVPHSNYGVPVQYQHQQIHSVSQQAKRIHPLLSLPFLSHRHFQQHQAHQIQQPASFYGAPVHHQQPVQQIAPVKVETNRHEKHHQQLQKFHQIHQAAPVYDAPTHPQFQNIPQVTSPHVQSIQHEQHYEAVQQNGPLISEVPPVAQEASLIYETPTQIYHHQMEETNIPSNNPDKLVFETPIQSVEVSQSHLIENVPTASTDGNVDTDAVSIAAVGTKDSNFDGYKYTQPTSSNGGYVY